jgi:hypothetical protein
MPCPPNGCINTSNGPTLPRQESLLVVKLCSPDQWLRLRSKICSSSSRASNFNLHSLLFTLICSSRQLHLSPFVAYYKLIAAALATLVNIRTLELRLQSARYIPILEKSSFPRLYKFASSMPFTSEVIVFINRHPAIRDLALLPQFITVKPPLQPVNLPNLKHVRTISETLPTVLAASPNVELVFLQHSSATPNLNQVAEEIDAIAKLAPNLRALQVTRPVLSLEVTLLISTRLSKLETLAIYRPRPRSSFDVEYEVVRTLPLNRIGCYSNCSLCRTLCQEWANIFQLSNRSLTCGCNTRAIVSGISRWPTSTMTVQWCRHGAPRAPP